MIEHRITIRLGRKIHTLQGNARDLRRITNRRSLLRLAVMES